MATWKSIDIALEELSKHREKGEEAHKINAKMAFYSSQLARCVILQNTMNVFDSSESIGSKVNRLCLLDPLVLGQPDADAGPMVVPEAGELRSECDAES